MTEADRRSPLHEAQVASGAEFIWEDGWPWTMRVGPDPLAEYEAIRTGVGIWDLFSTSKYEVTGRDAARLVQRRFTNDVSSMARGHVRYGAFVDAEGLLIDDGNVYRFDDDRFWVFINTADMEGWFRETAGDLSASIEHRTPDLPMISVQGPHSRDLLQGLTDAPLAGLGYFRFWPEPVTVADVTATVLRTGFSGEIGFELVVDPGSALTLWDALIEAGATPFGLEAIEVARTEAGLIIIAEDYQPGEISPWDLSMDRFIKAGTECVGADALAAYGEDPPKRLKTLRIDGPLPEAGTKVTLGGREVGTVTSLAASPRLGSIGLAIVATAASEDGTEVRVGDAEATVAPLGLYDPGKQKPRG